MKTKWIWLTTLTLLAALMLSGTVFAQSEEPPALPEDPAVVVAEAPVIAVEAAPAAEVPVIEEALPDAAPAAEPVAAEAAVPVVVEEPQVALVDAQGEPMDMASQASADLISSGDPWWKVGSTTYKTNFVGLCPSAELDITCWESDSPISLALTHIAGGLLPTDKKLYVETGDYTETVTIGSSLSQMKGLIGVNGSTLTTITGNVEVSNTVAGFTLQGFTINGYISMQDNTGALLLQDLDVSNSARDTIYVHDQGGNITLKNVKSHDNTTYHGAFLGTSVGNVSVSDSIFNHNDGIGLYIRTDGTTSLNNVITSENNGHGIYLDGNLSVSLKNVISNDNQVSSSGLQIFMHSGNLTIENFTASGNFYDGIDAELNAPVTVTIKNLTANENGHNGLYLETGSAVTITNSQTNGNIADHGLYIETSGKIVLNTIRSSNNGACGLYIKGIDTLGDPGIIAVASPTVTITSPKNAAQSNVFDGNDEGIWIETNKPVVISNFSASDNINNDGVLVQGFWYYQLNPDGTTYTHTQTFAGATTITATIPNYTNQVNNNHGYVGLGVLSSGNVKLERTWVNGNGSHGIKIITLGAITLKDVKANDNMGGCSLINNDSVRPMSITLTNAEFSRNNTDVFYTGAGLEIESLGNVTITNLTAIDNGNMGVGVINNFEFGVGKITLTNLTLNNNGEKGLWANSNGAISLKDVTANNNGGAGVLAQNDNLGFKTGIILTNVHANGNNGSGISAYTHGTLVVKDVEASDNAVTSGTIEATNTVQDFFNHSKGPDQWWFEAVVGTPYTLLMQADGYGGSSLLNRFTFNPSLALYDEWGNPVSGTTYNTPNSFFGIDFTPGSGEGGWYYVLASSTTNDGFYRLSINDSDPSDSTSYFFVNGMGYDAVGNVTFSGTNTFSDNADAGVIGWNDGNVIASNITASDNGAEGIYFDNLDGIGNVTLSGANVTLNNGWEGLRIDTNGTVKVTNFDGSGNGQDGVSIVANTAGKAVTLTHVTVLNNTLLGLNVKSDGNITLSNIRANDNIRQGIYLENCLYSGFGTCAGTGNITMSGFNEASNNHLNGLDVLTNGTVTISNLEVNSNVNTGISVEAFGINKKVTLNFINAMGNDGDGLYITSKGLTTLNTVRAWLNTQDGANVNASVYPSVVKYCSFIANDRYGLNVYIYQFTDYYSIYLGNGVKDLQMY
jgi:putative surface-exposed virulence protein